MDQNRLNFPQALWKSDSNFVLLLYRCFRYSIMSLFIC